MKQSSGVTSHKNLLEENTALIECNTELIKERDQLRQEIYRLQLEKDILEKAAEVIKKDQGISLQTLTNREKAIVIDTLRNQYTLKELLSYSIWLKVVIAIRKS